MISKVCIPKLRREVVRVNPSDIEQMQCLRKVLRSKEDLWALGPERILLTCSEQPSPDPEGCTSRCGSGASPSTARIPRMVLNDRCPAGRARPLPAPRRLCQVVAGRLLPPPPRERDEPRTQPLFLPPPPVQWKSPGILLLPANRRRPGPVQNAGHVRAGQVCPEVVQSAGRDGALHGPQSEEGG